MNKIIRIASVLALACSALLYVGCTKDFSGDVSRLETKDSELASDITALQSALEAYKTTANKAIADNAELIAKKADKSTVDALIEDINALELVAGVTAEELADFEEEVNDNFEDVADALIGIVADFEEEISDLEDVDAGLALAIVALADEDESLNTRIDNLETAYKAADANLQDQIDDILSDLIQLNTDEEYVGSEVKKLQKQMGDVIAMVQSITYIPSSYNVAGTETAQKYILTTPDSTYANAKAADKLVVSGPVVGLTFKVTPASAAKNLTADNVKLVVPATKAVATGKEDDAAFKINSVSLSDNGKGYVNVYAQYVGTDPLDCSVNLFYERTTENGVTESITNVHPIAIDTTSAPVALQYFFADASKVAAAADTIKLAYVEVAADAAADEIEKEVFTAGNLETVAKIDEAYYPLEEAAAILGAKAENVAPWKGDTVLAYTTQSDFVVTKKGIETTVKANPDVATPLNNVDNKVAGATDTQVVYLSYANEQAETEAIGSIVEGGYKVKPVEDVTTCVASGDLKVDWSWRIAPYAFKDSLYTGNVAITNCDSLFHDGIASIKIYDGTTVVAKVDTISATTDLRIAKVDAGTVAFSAINQAIEFAAAEKTYKVEIRNHTNLQIDYISTFNLIVDKKHADIVVALDEAAIDSLVFPAAGITIDNDMVAKLATEFDVDVTTPDSAAFVQRVVDTWEYAGIKDTCVVTPAASAPYVVDAGFTWISQEFLAAQGYGKYDFTKTLEALGIGVTVTQTVNVNKPAISLEPIESYLSASNVAGADYDAQIVGYADATNGYKYTLQTMPFHQYMFAKGNDKYKNADVNVALSAAVTGPEVPSDAITMQTANFERFAEGADTVKWGTFKKLEFLLGARLNNPQGAKLDSATIRLWTKDPIPTFTAGSVEVVEKFNDATIVSIFKAITVKDYLGQKLNDDTKLITAYTATVPDYGQALTLETDKTKWTCDDIDINLLDVTLDADGTFTLAKNQAALTGDITIKIPAKLTYDLGGDGKTADITVVIKKDANQ